MDDEVRTCLKTARQALILAWCAVIAFCVAAGTLLVVGTLAIETSRMEAESSAHLIDLNSRVKTIERTFTRAQGSTPRPTTQLN